MTKTCKDTYSMIFIQFYLISYGCHCKDNIHGIYLHVLHYIHNYMTSCGSPCKDTHSMIFTQFYLISYGCHCKDNIHGIYLHVLHYIHNYMTRCGSPCKDTHMIFVTCNYVYKVEHGGIYLDVVITVAAITYHDKFMECVSLHGEPQLVM